MRGIIYLIRKIKQGRYALTRRHLKRVNIRKVPLKE